MITYKKARTKEEIIKSIHEMDLEYVKEYGTSIVIPFIDKKTRKIIEKELKKLKIYHKVNIIVTNDIKAMHEQVLKEYKKNVSWFHFYMLWMLNLNRLK